ncbi:Zn-ribbon domain-containing OB-fold protein [Candidimonas nitroreducens]|uniref:ChsH2 C-terminal OB-fold domain-containing protein n=1 Tax=Candidimonas nitroreducens TaxID=683354 RepID=A0A225MCQ0_9BURK|nr:OB-fold domain-containing protein [Candidimonas nitroreducens]OWT58988.1 hypothetical protein CEY11_12365 [Candidimonas nitroreducens]
MQVTITQSPLQIYHEHLRRGELAYQFSPEAQKAVFFPRVACPFTGSTRLEWRVSAGRGRVYATTEVYPRSGDPYNVTLVDLDEGFRMMSRVEGVAADQVAIGAPVCARIVPGAGDEAPLVVFDLVVAGAV